MICQILEQKEEEESSALQLVFMAAALYTKLLYRRSCAS